MKFSLFITLLCLVFLTSCSPNYTAFTGLSALIKSDGVYHSIDQKASLEINGNCRILKLSGSASEMGYNYGALLGAEIVDLINNYIVYNAKDNYQEAYDKQSLLNWEKWDSKYLEELEGMLEGINDALDENQRMIYPYNIKPHVLDLTDLKMLNSLADWADAFGCSSFAIWKEGRTDGTSLVARNLDYLYDPFGIVTKRQLIISYDLPSGNNWVSVGFTGIIGCISGINENGLTLMMQNTNGFSSTDITGFVPRCLALREAIETLPLSSTPEDAEAFFEEIPAYLGNNFLICYQSDSRSDDNIAGVIEYDGKVDHLDGRATLRKPSDNLTLYQDHNLDYTFGIINKNHYIKRKDSVTEPSKSKANYLTIKEGLSIAKSDGNVDINEARDIMEQVGGYSTLHTIVFEPDNLKLYIYLAEPGVGAFDCIRHDFSFLDLF